MAKTPLAIFVYNRPVHTRRLLRSLENAARLCDVETWIFSDAPKKLEHGESVRETRDIVRSWAAEHAAHVCERDTNWGTKKSIVTAANILLENNGRLIVLEDDLVVAPDFLRFMLDALERYEPFARVMQISGHLNCGVGRAVTDGVFLPIATSWGWATWKRAWSLLRLDDQIDPGELDRDEAFRRRFTVGGACNYYEDLLLHCLLEPEHAWDIFWWYAIAKDNGLVLHPNHSLVWNGGFDGTGVRCGKLEDVVEELPSQVQLGKIGERISWPARIEVDKATFRMAAEQLALSYGGASLLTRLKHRVSALGRSIRA